MSAAGPDPETSDYTLLKCLGRQREIGAGHPTALVQGYHYDDSETTVPSTYKRVATEL